MLLRTPFHRVAAGVRGFYFWCHRHPVAGASLSVIAFVWALTLISAAPAYAAEASASTLTDSAGVPVDRYLLLGIELKRVPIVNNLPPEQYILTEWWKLSVETAKAFIDMMSFVLAFEWIEWLALPVLGISHVISTLIGGAGWIGFGMAVSAFVGGCAIWMGRTGSGVLEILAAAIAAALVGGALADPTQFLVRDGGGFDTMQLWGQQFSRAVVSNGSAESAFGDAITQPLVDILVRMPYQMISFGHLVEDSCGAILNDALISPQALEDNHVWEQVAECDEAAGEYVRNGSPRAMWLLFISGTGRLAVLVFVGMLALVFFVLVVLALWDSVMFLLGLFRAILPGNRRLVWKSGLGMVTNLIGLVVVLVMMAALLRLLIDFIELALQQVPYEMIMMILSLLMTVLIVLVAIVVYRMRLAAKASGEWLGKLGAGAPSIPAANIRGKAAAAVGTGMQLANTAMNLSQSKQLREMSSSPAPASGPAKELPSSRPNSAPRPSTPQLTAGGGGAAGPNDPGQAPSSPRPATQEARFERPPSGSVPDAAPPRKGGRVRSLAGAAAKVAVAGVLTGGGGAATAALGELGSRASAAWQHRGNGRMQDSAELSQSRKISVDASGQGTILDDRPSMLDASETRATPLSPDVMQLREQLESMRDPVDAGGAR